MISQLKTLFYSGKRAKTKDDELVGMMLPSFVGIIVCAVCLVGLTFAWFTTNIETEMQTMSISNWGATVTVTAEGKSTPEEALANEYNLKAGKYTVIVKADEGSTGSGYCLMKLDDKELYTEQISLNDDRGGEFEFSLNINNNTKVELATYWGTRYNDPDILYGGSVGESVAKPEVPDKDSSTDTKPTAPNEASTPKSEADKTNKTEPDNTESTVTEPIKTDNSTVDNSKEETVSDTKTEPTESTESVISSQPVESTYSQSKAE